MGGCGVPGCSSRSEVHNQDNARFFCVPDVRKNSPLSSQRRYERRRALWLSRMGRLDLMQHDKSLKICSRHFISGKPSAFNDETNADWAPSLYVWQHDAGQHGNAVANAEPERDHPIGNPPADAHHNESQVRVETEARQAGFASRNHDVPSECVNDHSEFPSTLNSEQESDLDDTVLRNGNVLEDFECDVVTQQSDSFTNSSEASFRAEQDILNSAVLSDIVPIEKINTLQADYDDLVNSRSKLRDKHAEVNKLEFSLAANVSNEKDEACAGKSETLVAETVVLKAEAKHSEAEIKVLKDKAKIADMKIHNLEAELTKARKCTLTLEQLQNDVSFIAYHTGLPSFGVFNAVLTLVNAHVTHSIRSLEPWQCLLLTLMRLRLGLELEDLAYRFGISKITACTIFERWLYYLYVYLEKCINWPDRETQYKTMPNLFKEEFGKSFVVIIDCFELFCERPGALDSNAMTWSDYEHHNTVKFLIGITPLGAISFISQGWGGRVSDKYMTTNSGVCEKLLPHDVILADKGFTIAEDEGFYCAKVSFPAFTHGRAQLSVHDITDTRRLASLRTHVERVIGSIKNRYRILNTTLNHYILHVKEGHKVAQIDEVVQVCCALTNLSPGIV